ncbi:hypothetical protein [Streptomyces sp. NPDC002276]
MAPVELLIGSRWQTSAGEGRTQDVTPPFDDATVGTLAVAGPDDVERALADRRAADIARTIGSESGRTITEATGEASRSGDPIRLAASAGSGAWQPVPAVPCANFGHPVRS